VDISAFFKWVFVYASSKLAFDQFQTFFVTKNNRSLISGESLLVVVAVSRLVSIEIVLLLNLRLSGGLSASSGI